MGQVEEVQGGFVRGDGKEGVGGGDGEGEDGGGVDAAAEFGDAGAIGGGEEADQCALYTGELGLGA